MLIVVMGVETASTACGQLYKNLIMRLKAQRLKVS